MTYSEILGVYRIGHAISDTGVRGHRYKIHTKHIDIDVRKFFGNSLDKLRHTRSVAYSVELVLLNKEQMLGGTAYPDCYRFFFSDRAN